MIRSQAQQSLSGTSQTYHECSPETERRQRGDLLGVIGLLLLTAVVYHKAWLYGRVFFDDDVGVYGGPLYHYAAERMREGSLPHWNPYLYGGTPFIVNPQGGTFYAPTWIHLLLPVQYAVMVLSVAHIVLAALLMYAFCRCALGVGPFAAFLGGAAFAHGGQLPAHYVHTPQLLSMSWLPGILLAYFRGRQTGRWGWFAASGAMLGLSLLAGGVQSVYVICVALAGLVVHDVVWPVSGARPLGLRGRLVPVLASCVIAATAALTAAAQLLPTLEFVPFSPRAGGLPFSSAGSFALPPYNALLLLFCPRFFGDARSIYWGVWNQHEMTVYVGLVPLILAPLGILRGWRQSKTLCFVWLGCVGLFLAFGAHTPVFRAAYAFLPGMAHFRAPARFSLLFGFCVLVLAALGSDGLVRGRRWSHWCCLGLVAGVWCMLTGLAIWLVAQQEFLLRLIWLGVPGRDRDPQLILSMISEFTGSAATPRLYYWNLIAWSVAAAWGSLAAVLLLRQRPALGRPVVAAVLMADLLLFNQSLAQGARAGAGDSYLQRRHWIDHLQPRMQDYRCDLGAVWPANLSMLHHLFIAEGYDAFLPQRRHLRLAQACKQAGTEARLPQLFAIAYIVTPRNQPAQGEVEFVSEDDSLQIVRRADVPPRARLVFEAERVTTESEALRRVVAPDFDPWRTVVLEGAESSEPFGSGVPEATAGKATNGHVTVLERKPERLRISVDSRQPGWLVVSDAHWPAWRAWLNGSQVPILRANYYFRAVAVPAGRCIVEMRYVDDRLSLGIAISLTTGLGLLSACIRLLWKRPATSRNPGTK